DKFIEGAVGGEKNFGHLLKVFIPQVHQLVWRQAFRNRGEPADVAEKHSEFLLLTAGTKVFVRIFFHQLDDAGSKILRKTLADIALGAFLANHAQAGNRRVIRRKRAGGNHKAEPLALMRKTEIHEPGVRGKSREHGDRGIKRRDAAEQKSENQAKQKDEAQVHHFFIVSAFQEAAALLLAMQQVVDDIGVDFDPHV